MSDDEKKPTLAASFKYSLKMTVHKVGNNN